MIPYDELVAALTTWRARQGLPVSDGAVPVPGSGPTSAPNYGSGPNYASGSTPQYGSGPTAMPGSGPVSSGTGPQRAIPPNAPPKGGYQPPPLETADDSLDVDDEA